MSTTLPGNDHPAHTRRLLNRRLPFSLAWPFRAGYPDPRHRRPASNFPANRLQPTFDRWLKRFDPVAERFVDDGDANRLLTRPYRAPFVVPDKV